MEGNKGKEACKVGGYAGTRREELVCHSKIDEGMGKTGALQVGGILKSHALETKIKSVSIKDRRHCWVFENREARSSGGSIVPSFLPAPWTYRWFPR